MSDTKENILLTALRLFAKDGYEAVSVSTIAGELGMTKGALYKHYKNKRDIFDSIVERMNQMDYEHAKEYEMPEGTFAQMANVYRQTTIKKIKIYSEAQFRRWTEDEFSASFRKMLTLEQYRNPEMSVLYQQYLVDGPIECIEDLFREMLEQGVWKQADPKQLALEFCAPIYLLISISDATEDKKEAAELVKAHIERFTRDCTKKECERVHWFYLDQNTQQPAKL